jgi:mannose-1-phosphate guanylyltransferase
MQNLEKSHLYVVILCGGGGTRLWPLSRNRSPKQFIELLGDETLFQKTLARAQKLVSLDHIYIMTNEEYVSQVLQFAPNFPSEQIIAEPLKRNTAMAMGLISAIIHQKDPDAVVINLASDHLIHNEAVFISTVLASARVAQDKQRLVAVGVEPSFAHPGLGYIERGDQLQGSVVEEIYTVKGFREKPNVELAGEYVASGRYYWNANLYTWSTELILSEFKEHSPEIYAHIQKIISAYGTASYLKILREEYSEAKEEQIDTAISEKTDKLVVIPGDFGWSDVGSWNVVHDEVEKDAQGNAHIRREFGAEWLSVDTQNSLVSTGRKLVATIGVSDLMIVETEDALLITHKNRAQDVKEIIAKLKATGLKKLL